jgi:hypothetical protein
MLEVFSQELKDSLERELPRDWDAQDYKKYQGDKSKFSNFSVTESLLYNTGSHFIDGMSYFLTDKLQTETSLNPIT